MLWILQRSRNPVCRSTALRTRRRSRPLSVLPAPSSTDDDRACRRAATTCGGTISSSSLSSDSSPPTTLLVAAPLPGHIGTLTGADRLGAAAPPPAPPQPSWARPLHPDARRRRRRRAPVGEQRRQPEALRHRVGAAGRAVGPPGARRRAAVTVVPDTAGRPHHVALVELERRRRAVGPRLRLLQEAKKPERARARRPRHRHSPPRSSHGSILWLCSPLRRRRLRRRR